MSYGVEVIVGFVMVFWVGMSLTLGVRWIQSRLDRRRCCCGIRHYPHHVIGRRR